ncbi:flagellar basal body P-ring formation chaperone FlgA [Albidovulum sp.]
MAHAAPILMLLTALWPAGAAAETLVAARTLRAQSLIGPGDVIAVPGEIPGAAATAGEVIGLETRVAIYQGRPLRLADLGPPALVERNQIVTLRYAAGRLEITAEGRALGRAGIGEPVRVMNLVSRVTLTGIVEPDGTIRVDSGS